MQAVSASLEDVRASYRPAPTQVYEFLGTPMLATLRIKLFFQYPVLIHFMNVAESLSLAMKMAFFSIPVDPLIRELREGYDVGHESRSVCSIEQGDSARTIGRINGDRNCSKCFNVVVSFPS